MVEKKLKRKFILATIQNFNSKVFLLTWDQLKEEHLVTFKLREHSTRTFAISASDLVLLMSLP